MKVAKYFFLEGYVQICTKMSKLAEYLNEDVFIHFLG